MRATAGNCRLAIADAKFSSCSADLLEAGLARVQRERDNEVQPCRPEHPPQVREHLRDQRHSVRVAAQRVEKRLVENLPDGGQQAGNGLAR